jgi:predicted nicotinamide N-methyase
MRADSEEELIELDGYASHGVSDYKIRGLAFSLSCVQELTPFDAMLLAGYEESESNSDQTGNRLWEGAFMLAEFIVSNPTEFQDKTVIELGSGCGLCGICASQVAASVTLTDSSDQCLELINDNVERNSHLVGSQCVTSAVKHSWGTDEAKALLAAVSPPGKTYDVVMASDCIYDVTAVEPIMDSAAELLSESGKFVLAHIRRCAYGEIDEIIRASAARHGMEMTEVPLVDFLEDVGTKRMLDAEGADGGLLIFQKTSVFQQQK